MKTILFLLFTTIFLYSQTNNDLFTYYSTQILTMKAQPKKHFEETKILIMHPLVKDNEVVMEHKSKLLWQNGKCQRNITHFSQKKGKKAKGGGVNVGKTFPFIYPDNQLKKFCVNKTISNWMQQKDIPFENKMYDGFTFTFKEGSMTKNGTLLIDKKGNLIALISAFNKDGISHADNMKESAYTWYFEGDNKNLRLVKAVEVEAKKTNGVPTTKVSTEVYSGF